MALSAELQRQLKAIKAGPRPLDTRTLRPRPKTLAVVLPAEPEGKTTYPWERDADTGEVVAYYTIRDSLPITTIMDFLNVSADLDPDVEDDRPDERTVLFEANQAICRLIRLAHPDAPLPEWGLTEIAAVIAYLVGNVSVEQEVVDALTDDGQAGKQSGKTGKRAAVKNAERLAGEEESPLGASAKRSSSRSSSSATRTAGRPSGGSRARGAASAST